MTASHKPIDRRQFTTGILASGIAASAPAQTPSPAEPEHFLLQPNGWMPNNPHLPVLLYRSAFPAAGGSEVGADRTASAMEAAFTAHGWPPQWRNGIYTFHHFHSTAQEILGIAAGEVRVALGGPPSGNPANSRELTLRPGDVVALPAGTGHCNLGSSPDLLVVGAYPAGEHWDICRSAPSPDTLTRMQHVAFPQADPVHGPAGPLPRLWLQT